MNSGQWKELNEGKVKLMTMEKFNVKAAADTTAFTSLNITYNLDSASTKVRLIHDFIQQVGATTLSLEVLVLDNAFGSIVEGAF